MNGRWIVPLALAWAAACGAQDFQYAGDAESTNRVVQIPRQIPAFSAKPPHEQRGFFPSGARLMILQPEEGGLMRVRFRTAEGRLIEGLCREADLPSDKPAGATPAMSTGRIVVPKVDAKGAYAEREWLEDAMGHDQAEAFQKKFDVPLLIYFYADWNDDCRFLWDQLLDTPEFKNQSKHFIKLKVDPEHGKAEGQLANYYRLREYPTLLVLDKPHAKPRRMEWVYWSFGKLKCAKPDYAVLDTMGGVDHSPKTNAAPAKVEEPPADGT